MPITLAVDFGSTYTKVVAIDCEGEALVGMAQAPTTVSEGVMLGLDRALARLEAACGVRRAACGAPTFRGAWRRPALPAACAWWRSAWCPISPPRRRRRAALGAGAKVLRAFAYELSRRDIDELLRLAPDMILLCGGTDGGERKTIVRNAGALAAAKLRAPIVVAGNRAAQDEVEAILRDAGLDCTIVGNVLPELDRLDVEPARTAIRAIFMDRITQAKGLDRAEAFVGRIVMPTPMAVLEGARLLASGERDDGWGDLVVVDVGGATTDVHSIGSGAPSTPALVPRGLPAVNHGLRECRRIADAVDAPLFARTASPDCRLTHEIMYGAGYTSCTAGAIVFSLGYAKDYPLAKAIEAWQYSYRMMGAYHDRGVTLSVEHYLPISTLVPQSMSMASVLLDSLIAAAQGVRCISLGIGQQCHLAQDAAALRAYPALGRYYLDAFGFHDVELSTVMSQWMGGFPADEGQAFGVICMAALAGYLGGVTYMISKSPHEAIGVPTTEANVHGLTASKMVLRMLADQQLAPIAEIAEEQAIIEAETRAIVDRALELGDGDAALGAIRAIEAGVIDVPFSPHRSNANQALPARDWRGAVRLAQFGGVPIPQAIREHHEAALARRSAGRMQRAPWELLLADVNAISEGMLLPD